MSRTYRDYCKQQWCHYCITAFYDKGYPGVWTYRPLCEHNMHPWTHQHRKRRHKYDTKTRKGKRDRFCCGGPFYWRRDLFWLWYDVQRSELNNG